MLLKRMTEEGESKISLHYPMGLGASPQSFRERVGIFSACRMFVDD